MILRSEAPGTMVTWTVLGLCLLISIPTMIDPSLYRFLGGFKPLGSEWQRLTLPFQHGFPGLPSPVHLALDAALLLTVGAAAERVLGSGRFALLTLAAMVAYAVAHTVPPVDGHGASGLLWAYAPVVFVATRGGGNTADAPARFSALLAVMWVVVPLFVTVLVTLSGYRGNPILAFFLGNIFHLSGTIVGVVGAMAWRERIRRRRMLL